MKQTSRARLEAVEKLIKNKPTWPTCDCLMNDGGKKRLFGMMVIQPFLDGEIAAVTTNDADLAAMLRAMDVDETITIEVKEF